MYMIISVTGLPTDNVDKYKFKCLSQNSNKHDLFNEEIETDRFIIQSLAIYNPNFLDRSLI